jgi:hypothetical protein
MKDIFTWFAGAIGEQFGTALGAIVMAAAGLAWFMQMECSGALKEKGPDRIALLGFLRRGGSWRWRYTRIVNRALDRLDWLLGDKGLSTRACRWVTGRDGAQPCWTGRSFDRCALLALAYPLVSIWVIWVAWGAADDIGLLLGLRTDEPFWRRLLSVIFILLIGSAFGRFAMAERRAAWSRGLLPFAAGAGAASGGVVLAVIFAVAVAAVVVLFGAVPGVGVGAFAVALVFAGARVVAGAFDGRIAGAAAAIGAAAIVAIVLQEAERAFKAARLGHVWLVFFPGLLLAMYAGLWVAAWVETPPTALLLIVMLGLVPLLNLPLDWLSIGFTRGLLRRGCTPNGNPVLPFLFGAADFVIGIMLLSLLIVVLILGLQLADALVVHAGGKLLINVPERLYRLYAEPGAPKNWWIYVTLFSTMVPSALNLMVGTISLTTVSRRATRADLIRRIRRLPDTGRASTRFRISVRLMLPVFVGSILSGLILWGVFLVLSWFGSLALHTLLFIAAEAADLFPVTPPRP